MTNTKITPKSPTDPSPGPWVDLPSNPFGEPGDLDAMIEAGQERAIVTDGCVTISGLSREDARAILISARNRSDECVRHRQMDTETGGLKKGLCSPEELAADLTDAKRLNVVIRSLLSQVNKAKA